MTDEAKWGFAGAELSLGKDVHNDEFAHPLARKLERSHEIVTEAIETHKPARVIAMLSGGNDSTTMLHAIKDRIDAVLHINTGIGIEDTRKHVRNICALWGLTLFEYTPPPIPSGADQIPTCKTEAAVERMKDLERRVTEAEIDWYALTTYEQFVLRFGFPGPAGHRPVYIRLKERTLEKFLRETRSKRGEKTLLLSGVRSDESQRRMGIHQLVDVKGGQVWVNPFFYFSKDDLNAYREQHDVPHNEVSDHLHMSGECLCGAFAKPGELETIRFFYPQTADYIEQVQRLATAIGQPACRWGMRPGKAAGWTGPMCHSCDVLENARREAGIDNAG